MTSDLDALEQRRRPTPQAVDGFARFAAGDACRWRGREAHEAGGREEEMTQQDGCRGWADKVPRRAIGAADCHPLSVRRFAPGHQSAAAPLE
jgi:hypothetical protein